MPEHRETGLDWIGLDWTESNHGTEADLRPTGGERAGRRESCPILREVWVQILPQYSHDFKKSLQLPGLPHL